MSGPVLAATDFSARADRAIDRAIALGEQLGKSVTLVHVPSGLAGKAGTKADLDARMQAVLPATDTAVKFAYPEGRVATAIADYADCANAAVLAIGAVRHNSIGDFFIGSAADEIIRSCGKPVMIVKNRPHGPYETIIVATDFSDDASSALDWALGTFPAAAIHLVHAFHVPYEAWNNAPYVSEEIEQAVSQRLEQSLADIDTADRERVRAHAVKANVASAINRISDKVGAQLVIAGSHGESGFRHATIGSQANHLLTTTKVDTLIISPRIGA